MKDFYYKNDLPLQKDLFELFISTGWNDEYKLTLKKYFNAVKNSWYFLCAYDADILIAFGRIISDGILHSLIVDLMVLPEYQGKGVGKNILKRLTEKCISEGITDIKLFCAKGKSEFYLKNGFKVREIDAPGMEIKCEIK